MQTSNLNEQLGQVDYVFSDKTGTLTCNIMTYKKMSVGKHSYGIDKPNVTDCEERDITNFSMQDPDFDQHLKNRRHENHNNIIQMMNILAVCHTVVIETRKGKDYYNAASPDELALVNCAKYYGWEFKGRDESNNIEITVGDKKEQYQLLNVMEFTSGRKRMSVIVKNPKGQIIVMCKGADSIILERLADSEENKEIVEVTNRYLEGYAKDGLRTLLLGQKELTQAEYDSFQAKLKEASQSMTDRDDKIEEVASDMERGFRLIGSTAIEDKLQDDVDGTIKFMREAGIRVWVLTGDKIETAINIGFSCKLLTNEMQ